MVEERQHLSPGHIISYDGTTRRARVRPAIDILTTDNRLISPPEIADVPVLFPAGGGYLLAFPLAPGDSVLLLFCQRGISEFKQAFTRSGPDRAGLFSLSDAVALAGFGSTVISAASTTGAALQSAAGNDYIVLEANGIRIKSRGVVSIEATDVTINGTSIRP